MKIFLLGITLLASPITAHASVANQLFNDPLTLFFIFLISVTAIFLLVKFDRFAVMHGPEILTTLGIFGCFFGIAFALVSFDPKNATESVPKLLDGVKTAFWASVFGVFWALVIKFRQRFSKAPIPIPDGEPKAASLEDVVHILSELRKSIAGSEDSSLVAQIKLMRQEQNDNSLAMRKSLDDFAAKISELGSKALIEALEKVIRDFNTKLTEQFGENFKQLNLAVEKLVIWQQQYKEELDKLQGHQKQASADLKTAAQAFNELVEKSKSYTESAQKLTELLLGFERQYALMVAAQESLTQVLTNMKSAEPEFSKKLEDLTNTFKVGTTSIVADIQKSIDRLSAEATKLTTEFGQKTQAQVEAYGELLKNTIPEIQKGVNAQITNTNEQLKKNFETLDKNLEAELQKALVSMGQQLASLSEKFVQDYTPLTDRLREVVNISRGV